MHGTACPRRIEVETQAWPAQSRLLALYLMSTILYLPTPAKGRSQAPIQESAAQESVIRCSQTERIAHDLKNCMSVLLLAITSLKDNQPLISESRKRVLENVVEEMNRLVDEMVRLGGKQVNK
jgi:K+-sensing histidine kinase KdpD